MKYFAINWYDDKVWVESGEFSSRDEAERELSRNNPQLILTEEELLQIFRDVGGYVVAASFDKETKRYHRYSLESLDSFGTLYVRKDKTLSYALVKFSKEGVTK